MENWFDVLLAIYLAGIVVMGIYDYLFVQPVEKRVIRDAIYAGVMWPVTIFKRNEK